jgi:hypothetical protein
MDATAPDGSPVGLYATLAPLGEQDLIHTSRLIADAAVEAALARAGLRRTRWLDERRSWLEAAPSK